MLWEEHRKFATKILRNLGFGKRVMEPRITQEFYSLLEELRQSNCKPIYLRDLLQLCMTNIVFSVTLGKRFGYREKQFKDVVKATELQIKLISQVAPLSKFPWLTYLPGDLWKEKRMIELIQHVYDFIDITINQGGRVSENYVDEYIEERKRRESKGDMHTFTGELYSRGGGVC